MRAGEYELPGVLRRRRRSVKAHLLPVLPVHAATDSRASCTAPAATCELMLLLLLLLLRVIRVLRRHRLRGPGRVRVMQSERRLLQMRVWRRLLQVRVLLLLMLVLMLRVLLQIAHTRRKHCSHASGSAARHHRVRTARREQERPRKHRLARHKLINPAQSDKAS